MSTEVQAEETQKSPAVTVKGVTDDSRACEFKATKGQYVVHYTVQGRRAERNIGTSNARIYLPLTGGHSNTSEKFVKRGLNSLARQLARLESDSAEVTEKGHPKLSHDPADEVYSAALDAIHSRLIEAIESEKEYAEEYVNDGQTAEDVIEGMERTIQALSPSEESDEPTGNITNGY